MSEGTPMPRQLILVPTERERRVIVARLVDRLPPDAAVEPCGFGLVAAAARTAQLLAESRPDRVILAGIAGRLGESLALGGAALFEAVACHGIGAGSGARFVTAARMGWPQWPGTPTDPDAAIGDSLPCSVPRGYALVRSPLLLSVAAASADAEDVRLRRESHPAATAEEMEGFGVAVACRLARVPLTIVRGISNDAGDRDTARWRIDEALLAAADLVVRIVEGAR